jgi:hypothetical protein
MVQQITTTRSLVLMTLIYFIIDFLRTGIDYAPQVTCMHVSLGLHLSYRYKKPTILQSANRRDVLHLFLACRRRVSLLHSCCLA